MKKWLALLMAVIFIFAVTGCGGPTAPADEVEDAVDLAEDQIVFMITDMGGIDDASFNEITWAGLDRFGQEFDGWTARYIESAATEDYIPNMRAALEAGSDLIWAVGYMMADDLDDIATDNPDQKFGIVDWAQDELRSNVAYVVFHEHEGSFLVGMVAGLMTESNRVGFVGGMEGDLIKKFEVGFRAGVYAVNPDAEVMVQYAQSWIDTEKGEQIATQMIGAGADVIYQAAGGVGIGVAEACKNAGVWFIGVDKDQSFLAPEYTLTSMLKRVDNAVYTISVANKDGQFPGGQVMAYGLAEGGVDYVQSEFIPADIITMVEEIKAKIIAGELEVPFTEEGFETFVAAQ